MHKTNIDGITHSKVLTTIILLVLVEPEYFTTIPVIHQVYNYLSILLALCLLVLMLIRGHIQKTLICILALYAALGVSTILNSEPFFPFLTGMGASFALCIMFDIWLRSAPEVLLDAASVLQILVYINLLTVLLWPDGLFYGFYRENWFLGFKNVHIRTILPIVCLMLIRSYKRFGYISISCKMLLLASMVTFLLVGSTTSLIGFVVFLLLVLLFHQRDKSLPRFFSLKNVLIVTLLLLPPVQNVVGAISLELFHKTTLITRFDVWKSAWRHFLEAPVFGRGYLSGDGMPELFSDVPWRPAHPHNFILYILTLGGLLAFAIIVYCYVYAGKKLRRTNHSITSKIILYTLICFLVMGLSESLTGTDLLYPTLVLAMNADIVDKFVYPRKMRVVITPKIKIKLRN